MKSSKLSIQTVFFHSGAMILGFLAMVPFLWMLSTSLKDGGALITIPIQWIPKSPTFNNYINAFTRDGIFRSMLNSFFVTFGSVAVTLVCASMAAFAFSKIKFKGRDILFMIFLGTMMIPSQVLFIPTYLIMNELKLTDSLYSLILPNIFKVFAIFMLRQQMMSIPNSYLEAARIDGANLFRQFVEIICPMCKTTFITLFVIRFMDSWNDYLLPLVLLTSRENYTLPIILNSMAGQYKFEFNLLMAGAMISLLPILLLYAVAQKYFSGGLQFDGVK